MPILRDVSVKVRGKGETGMPAKLMRAHKVVGTKQTLKALEAGRAGLVYIAKDADTHVTNPVKENCERLGVEVVYVDTMAELGRACGIDVGAAVACLLKE
jgi:large subunit ribosomal protein L7A